MAHNISGWRFPQKIVMACVLESPEQIALKTITVHFRPKRLLSKIVIQNFNITSLDLREDSSQYHEDSNFIGNCFVFLIQIEE